ncbi:hypothetical protein ACFQGE_13100 [Halomicroarcula sp. GCM10025817]|uniref:hypothetical protein n=1 Tax=Haloarcula TaxID=2237 RepID=UPI0023E7F6EF|nr:hypothetical protein [Halomicroarcula sp. SYNS111]
MPSTQEIDRPQEAVDVAKRYLRRERPLSALVVVLVASVFLGTFLATSLLPALVVGVLLVLIARAPLIQSHGTARLLTKDTPDVVVDAFAGPTPPVLAFQWGIADEITASENTVMYRIPYFFGLRSVESIVRSQTETTPSGARHVELEVTVNGQPWATYTAIISTDDGQTSVDIEYTSNRRFGLRRIPQQIVAERYRNDALTAQGYTVVERDTNFGI